MDFFFWVFFHDHSGMRGLQEKEEGTSLTPQNHFHPLQRHLDISRAITAGRTPGLKTRDPLVSERKSLITKLRALKLRAQNF